MDEKEKWFRAYVEMTTQAQKRLAENPPKQTDGLFHCPCCGFPTLDERGGYDICNICWWEDDGQDDYNSDMISGGPNHGHSLDRARENFLARGHMYDIGKEISYLKNPDKRREDLMKLVRPVLEGGEAFDMRAYKAWKSSYYDSLEEE